MKKIKKIITVGLLSLLGTVSLNGCGFFNGEEAVSNAFTIEKEEEETGVKITIIFDDETKEPISFFIEYGEDGKDGSSIESIDPITIGDQQGIRITYSGDKDPVEIPIPSGNGIAEVHTRQDDDGNTVFWFIYTDGNPSEEITVYKGDKGENGRDGIGIEAWNFNTQPDGSINVFFQLSSGVTFETVIPAPMQGVGIQNIEADTTDNGYTITMTYTDETTHTVEFPRSATWFDTDGYPNASLGINGDYAFDSNNGVIYEKINGAWIKVLEFDTNTALYTVEFNNEYSDVTWISGEKAYIINRGKTFVEVNKDVPVLYKPGYVFKGWSTKSSSPSVVNGMFTDLTPVMSDLKLYSIFEKKAEVNFFANTDDDVLWVRGVENYTLENGHTFNQDGLVVPILERDGFTFKGWCTEEVYNPTCGLFTDLTAVNNDLNLYAIWESL